MVWYGIVWKGTDGVSTDGVPADFMFFDSGTFLLGTPVNLLYLPKSARAYLFPQSVKTHYFCSSPISVDPMCPQPSKSEPLPRAREHARRRARACGHALHVMDTEIRLDPPME